MGDFSSTDNDAQSDDGELIILRSADRGAGDESAAFTLLAILEADVALIDVLLVLDGEIASPNLLTHGGGHPTVQQDVEHRLDDELVITGAQHTTGHVLGDADGTIDENFVTAKTEELQIRVQEESVTATGAIDGELTKIIRLLADDVVRGLADAQATVRILKECHAGTHGKPELLVTIESDGVGELDTLALEAMRVGEDARSTPSGIDVEVDVVLLGEGGHVVERINGASLGGTKNTDHGEDAFLIFASLDQTIFEHFHVDTVVGVDRDLDEGLETAAEDVGGLVHGIMHQRRTDDDGIFVTVMLERLGEAGLLDAVENAVSFGVIDGTEAVVTGHPQSGDVGHGTAIAEKTKHGAGILHMLLVEIGSVLVQALMELGKRLAFQEGYGLGGLGFDDVLVHTDHKLGEHGAVIRES